MNPWWIEAPGPGRLAVCPRPRGGDWLEDDLRMLRLAGVDVLGSALTALEEAELGLSSEEQLARDGGLQFVRLTTPDFGAPAMGAVSRPLEDLVAALRRGESVAVHCRMGVGRSPLFAACLLVSLGIAPEEAWRRVEAARGVRVPDTDAQRSWLWTWHAECARRSASNHVQ